VGAFMRLSWLGRGARTRRRALGAGLAAVIALLMVSAPAGAPARAAAAPAWFAGAAAEKITPPADDAASDSFWSGVCNLSVYNGPRRWAFEEPYQDVAGSGEFDYTQDPYCDANHNGRHDELYSSGGVDHILEWVHDDLFVRALAVSDGAKTVVVESITSQGMMNEDIERIRSGQPAVVTPAGPLSPAGGLVGYQPKGNGLPAVAELFASSTHNESSPDPIGIYGAPDNGTGAAGLYSGIDDYYMTFVVGQAIKAGQEAADAMKAATLSVSELQPSAVRSRLSSTFPTTDSMRLADNHDDTVAATDPKLRVLQVRDAATGGSIETVLNFAAHNQQVGHASDSQVYAGPPGDPNNGKRVNRAVSEDWPGQFTAAVEAQLGGHAMFLVGDNGSIEDPHLYNADGSETAFCARGQTEGCFELAHATGGSLAGDVVGAVQGTMAPIEAGVITFARDKFDVPLHNQLFAAAFAGGLFADRHMAADGAAQGIAGPAVATEVGLLNLGPDLQVLANPGEAYPSLVEGNPWGLEDAACPMRPEPLVGSAAAVPAWHATAAHHLEMGLADDMVGYEIPGPEWFADPAVYADPTCPLGAAAQSDPTADIDANGHYHKLESESVGPEAGTLVAQHLATLADAAAPAGGSARVIESGRFLKADGTFTRRGADGPVGIWVLPAGTTAFAPGTGTVVALPGITSFGTDAGAVPVKYHGTFMDFDGLPQAAPDLDTRGMIVTNPDGTMTRYFVDPYPTLTGAPPGPAVLPEFPPVVGAAAVLLALAAAARWRRRRAYQPPRVG